MRNKKRFLLISIIPQAVSDSEAVILLRELKSLVDTFGGEVVDWVVQRREIHSKGSYIGGGKMREAENIISDKQIDIVVLNGIVKPGQIYDMKKIFMKHNFTIEVWDKVDLILQIFSKHAHTAEARLQIELAAMRHMGPRIYGMGMELSRQSGGIGTRGIGETNTERMKRHWREQIKKTKEKLAKLAGEKERQLDRRRKAGFVTVSLIGYTNAGKTSLFNVLTGKKKQVQNALFVTLDSALGRMKAPGVNKEILVSDTIGFIRDLPARLIDAFKSTLMESINADILLHVIDISDNELHAKIAIVEDILLDLGLEKKKRVYVFNKTDLVDTVNKEYLTERYRMFDPQFISAASEKNIEELINAIAIYI